MHENGARIPSLRRLYKKKPYFTNGSASDVQSVLARVRFLGGETRHDGTTDGAALDRETIESLEAFLDLL